jgi:hypothetical protein
MLICRCEFDCLCDAVQVGTDEFSHVVYGRKPLGEPKLASS